MWTPVRGYLVPLLRPGGHRRGAPLGLIRKYGHLPVRLLLVGLTATPKDEVDHNTYRLFHLEDRCPPMPTTQEGRRGFPGAGVGVSVGTKFLRQGIRYADPSEEEKDEWTPRTGEDGPPDEVSSDELNRFLFNEDTVDQVLGTFDGAQGTPTATGWARRSCFARTSVTPSSFSSASTSSTRTTPVTLRVVTTAPPTRRV